MEKWENPAVVSEHLLDAHAGFAEEAVSLSGKWRFFSQSGDLPLPGDWLLPDFDDKKWRRIAVPGSWEAQQVCDCFHYAGSLPAGVTASAEDCRIDTPRNLVGLYRRSFTLAKDQGSRQIILRFARVSSCALVWVNGEYIGMIKGSHAPAEFDITTTVRQEKNIVCVQVLRWSDATYLEHRGQWLTSGILGDVSLHSLPSRRITDIHTELCEHNAAAALAVHLKLHNAEGFTARIALMDEAKVVGYCQSPITGDEAHAVIPCPDARLWTARTPKLYRVAVILWDGVAMYHTRQISVGLRCVEWKDGGLLLNGKPEKLFAVGYRAFDPGTGCFLPDRELERELTTIRDHNFNAIHLTTPAPGALYDICDRLGLYVLDESAPFAPGNAWQEQIDLAHSRLVACYRSHPCILAWNNQTACDNILSLARIKLLTFPGVPAELEQTVDQIRSSPQLAGGLFGEYMDQVFLNQTAEASPEGLCSADGLLRSPIRAARALFQPVSMVFDQGVLTVHNHCTHRSLSALDCRYVLTRDGEKVVTRSLMLDAAPGESASREIETKYDIYKAGRYHLAVEFAEKDDGRVIARDQWPVAQLRHIYDENPGGAIREDSGSILLRAKDWSYEISRASGNLEQIRYKDTSLLTECAYPVYSHPRTGSGLRLPDEWEKLTTRKKKPKPSVLEVDHMTRSVTASFHLGSGLMQSYRLHSDGSMAVELRLRTGRTAPDRLGMRFRLWGKEHELSWFGFGPDDAPGGDCPGNFSGIHRQSIGAEPCGCKEPVYTLHLYTPGQPGLSIRSEEGLRASVAKEADASVLIVELPTEKMKPHTTYFFSFTILPE